MSIPPGINGHTADWLEYALHDEAHPGVPRRFEADAEHQVIALACSAPSPGASRWTVALLTQAAQCHPEMRTISRETIRRKIMALMNFMCVDRRYGVDLREVELPGD